MRKANFKNLYNRSFVFLFFAIPLAGIIRPLPVFIVLITTLLFFTEIKKREFINNCKNSIIYVYSFFIVYLFFRMAIENGLSMNFVHMDKFVLPLFICFLFFGYTQKTKLLKIAFIVGTCVSILISTISITIYVIEQGQLAIASGSIVNKVLITERVYLAFACVLSFIFSIDLTKQTNGLLKKLVVVNIIILVSFILLIAARMAFISIILVTVYYLLFIEKRRIFLGVLGIFCVISVIAFAANENLQKRFFYKDKKKSFWENVQIWEPRYAIWQCVYLISNQDSFNTFFGLGSYHSAKNELVNCYRNTIEHPEKRKWFLSVRYNTHNQFLDILIVFGCFGLFLFLAIFIIAIIDNSKRALCIKLMIAFLLFSLVENYFHRQMGSFFFAVFLVFLMPSKGGDKECIKNLGTSI